jgi:hypothetical protein
MRAAPNRRVLALSLPGLAALLLLGACATRSSGGSDMSFFVTSAGPGRGADLGGLAGADRQCQSLASAAGAGGHTWHAYLSTNAQGGAVNARDRIGRGPWRNAKGEVIARDLAELHGEAAGLTKQTALNERGAVVNGRGDTPNMHDILTGSQADGTAFPAGEDRTCRNWTSGDAGSAMLGHSDRIGLNDSPPMKSWNTSHPSRGCNMEALKATGGAGLFYCFAAD